MILVDGVQYRRGPVSSVLDFLYSGMSGLSVALFFCSVWALLSYAVGPLLLPGPTSVFNTAVSIIKNMGEFDIVISLKRLLIASSMAMALGISLGIIAYNFKSFLLFIKPIISIMLGIAPIIWIVLALFWFGFGDVSVVFTVVMAAFPITFGATLTSLNLIPEDIKNMVKVYKIGPSTRLLKVYLPYFLSGILPSILITFTNSSKLILMAELLGSNTGIGAKVAAARVYLDTETVLAMVSVCIVFITAFNFLIIKPLEILVNQHKRNY